MKIIFESDGTSADLQRLSELLQKLARPTVNPVARLGNMEFTEVQETTTGHEINSLVPTPNPDHVIISTVDTPVKKRKHGKHRMRKPKADPYKLIKQGYVVRGPYPRTNGAPSELVITNPKNMWKDKVTYMVGTQVDDHDVMKLKALAEPNEKNVPPSRRGRAPRKKAEEVATPPEPKKAEQEGKPDPFELVKQGWIVKGPWKEGGKTNPYMALYLYSPDNSQRVKYIVGKTKAGYQGLTDDDVKKLKMQAGMAEVQLPPSSDPIPEVTIKPGEEIPAEPLKELPKDNNSQACQICFARGKPLGRCGKMSSIHCGTCHDSNCGNYLYTFKPL